MSAIRLDRVVKSWGAARAVDGISLEADEGSLLVLLGPSGCGKSTTLRLIAGLEQPDSGTVTIGGRGRHPSDACPAQDRDGIPILRAVSPSQRGGEHRVRPAGAPGFARRARFAAQAGCGYRRPGQLLERKPSQLSGGQRQRVALGRAIIAEARALPDG